MNLHCHAPVTTPKEVSFDQTEFGPSRVVRTRIDPTARARTVLFPYIIAI